MSSLKCCLACLMATLHRIAMPIQHGCRPCPASARAISRWQTYCGLQVSRNNGESFAPGLLSSMGIDDNTGIGKLLASHLHAIMRIAQNTHDSDHTVSNSVLALNRQLRYHLFIFYISLDSYDGGNCFQLIQNRKHSLSQFMRQNIL